MDRLRLKLLQPHTNTTMAEKKASSTGSDNRKVAEKIREKTNNLTDEERFRLLDQGLEIIYGASGKQATQSCRL